jgi:SulP family sulfate permease
MLKPRLVECLRAGYSPKDFIHDLAAGVMVGIVAIPLAVAFAIASGVTPDKGLLTAVVAGFIISALGGSHVQIGGPTGAFIVIVYGIVSKFGLEGLAIATLMAGLMLLALGFGRLGSVIQFIPYPVIVGFTSGIAVVILSSQVNDFLGLGLTGIPGDFIGKWEMYLSNLDKTNPWAMGMALATILAIVALQRINRKIPAALLVLITATATAALFPGTVKVETIASRFGAISGSFSLPSLPRIDLDTIRQLMLPAVSIAMLAGIESLLSAVVADGLTGKKHDSNMELVAQGFANLASALFGGIPATGAIARTATNIRSGGRTPVAGIIHAVFLLGVLLFLSPLAGMIPLAALAGILTTVAYNMSEHTTFRMLLKSPPGDLLALLATFFLTVLLDLTVAVPLGILLALLAFIRRMSLASCVRVHTKTYQAVAPEMDPFGLTAVSLPEGVEVFEIDGPLFFGAAERMKEELTRDPVRPTVRILLLRDVPSVDVSGIKILREVLRAAGNTGTRLLFAAIQPPVRAAFDRIGFTHEAGEENFLPEMVLALHRAHGLLGHRDSSLAQKVAAGRVVGHLPAADPLDVIGKTVPLLVVREELRPRLLKSLLEREELSSTGMGSGLAFPHPRDPLLAENDEESVNFVYLEYPVEYHSPDDEAVHTAVFILSNTVQSHLKTLARLAKLSREPEFMRLLRDQAPREALVSWLERHDAG